MSPFVIVSLISAIVTGVIAYMVVRMCDVSRPGRWSTPYPSGIIFSCTLFIGVLGGGAVGFWWIYKFFLHYHMYAPLEGMLWGAFWGAISCASITGLYIGYALQRKKN